MKKRYPSLCSLRSVRPPRSMRSFSTARKRVSSFLKKTMRPLRNVTRRLSKSLSQKR